MAKATYTTRALLSLSATAWKWRQESLVLQKNGQSHVKIGYLSENYGLWFIYLINKLRPKSRQMEVNGHCPFSYPLNCAVCVTGIRTSQPGARRPVDKWRMYGSLASRFCRWCTKEKSVCQFEIDSQVILMKTHVTESRRRRLCRYVLCSR